MNKQTTKNELHKGKVEVKKPKPFRKRFKVLFRLMKEITELHEMSLKGGMYRH